MKRNRQILDSPRSGKRSVANLGRGGRGSKVRAGALVMAAVGLVVVLSGCRPFGMVGDPSFEARSTPGFPSAAGPTLGLTDVRSARHTGFERAVVEVSGDRQPSWQVSYEPGPFAELGSGEPVAVNGEAFLVIRATPVSGVDRTTTPWTTTYDGPSRVTPSGSGVITEVVAAGDFEGNVVWVIGLRQQVPFAAVFYESPSRVVVDVLDHRP